MGWWLWGCGGPGSTYQVPSNSEPAVTSMWECGSSLAESSKCFQRQLEIWILMRNFSICKNAKLNNISFTSKVKLCLTHGDDKIQHSGNL